MIALPRVESFRARLTLRWTLAVGLLLGAATGTIYAAASAYLHRWVDENVRTIAATEAASSTDGLGDVHLHEGSYAQLGPGRFSEKFVQIFDADARLVLQSTALAGHPPLVPPAEIARALAGEAPILSVDIGARRGRMAVLTSSRDGRPFAVGVGLYTDDIHRGLSALAWLLTAVWVAGVGVTAALGYGLASRALAPVQRITEQAAWIAQGNFDARLDPPPVADEVGRMTVLLNSMLDRLHGAVTANRRFAADASHELRGPLTAMAGELDVTLRHPRSADDYRDTLRHVRGQLSALTALAEDLILLARAQEGTGEATLRELDLAALVDQTFGRQAGAAAARGVALVGQGLEGVTVYADHALLARVLDNVVLNAIQYGGEGGTVTVDAEVAAPAADAWTAAQVTIRVSDTGPGIPEPERERIFERFYRLDRSRARHTGGSGLGLAICREVLAVLRGAIRVAASGPDGTTMAITLPGRGGAPRAPGAGRREPEAVSGSARA
ncbi:MAG: ATP-binding protein [Vicinamibacterales bacterium]